MQLLITYRALKILFQSQEKEEVAKLERQKTGGEEKRKEKKKNNTVVKSSVEKASDKWECFFKS